LQALNDIEVGVTVKEEMMLAGESCNPEVAHRDGVPFFFNSHRVAA